MSKATKVVLDLYNVKTINLSNVKSISQKTAEISPENEILAKDNYSYTGWSSVTKLKFYLYYVNANSYTKFQVNISKDLRERSGKLTFSKGQKQL